MKKLSPGDLEQDIRNLDIKDFSKNNGNRNIRRNAGDKNDKHPTGKTGSCQKCFRTFRNFKINSMSLKFFFLMLSLLTIYGSGYSQKKPGSDSTEEKCIKVFKDFNNYIKHCIKDKSDITSDTSMKYILLNYLFVDRKLDSANTTQLDSSILTKEESNNLKKELQNYLRYFLEREDKTLIDNVGITPLGLRSDKFIYDQMTKFQKTNTYVLYDKRNPDKLLFYILFMPPIKDYINEPGIWSWNLGFRFGKFYFTSPIGEEGYEYLFP